MYDGFISYSHAADGLLAPRLQTALQRFAKPWYRRRALHIFRDETGLSTNPGLWTSITDALDTSKAFVLLASPEAAQSIWVEREIQHWLEVGSVDTLLVVQTDGELVWDEATGDFDWTVSTAVPPALKGVFREEPRHLDMRWAKQETQLDLRNGRFRDQVAQLAAPMHGVPKDDLVGEEVRQHRRALRLAWVAGIALALLSLASIAGALFAVRNANEAAAQQQQAEANATRADANATEAGRQKDEADRQRTDADQQRSEALRQKGVADDQRTQAEKNADEAKARKLDADTNAAEASKQAGIAQQNANEANASAAEAKLQKLNADNNAALAQKQKELADASAIEAKNQEALAIAAQQQTEAANVALQASNEALAAETQVAIDNQNLAIYNETLAKTNEATAKTNEQIAKDNEARANTQAAIATSRGLAANATALSGTELDTAMLLAAQAEKIAPMPDASVDAGLLSTMNTAPWLEQIHQELRANKLWVSDMSRNGRTLAYYDEAAGEVQLFDLTTRSVAAVQLAPAGHNQFTALRFSPGGAMLAATTLDNAVVVWDVTTGAKVLDLSVNDIGVAADFSADGSLLATVGYYSGVVNVFDMSTGLPVCVGGVVCGAVPQSGAGGYAVALSPDGSHVVMGTLDGWVNSIDVSTMTVQWAVQVAPAGVPGEAIGALVFSPDGTRVNVGDYLGYVGQYALADGFSYFTPVSYNGGRSVTALATDATGDTLFVGGEDGTLGRLQLTSHLWLNPMHANRGTVWRVMVQGIKVVTVGTSDVAEWDLSHPPLLTSTAALPTTPDVVGMSADGASIAVIDTSRTVTVYDRGTMAARGTVQLNAPPVGAPVFSPDGRNLAVALDLDADPSTDLDRDAVTIDVTGPVGQQRYSTPLGNEGHEAVALAFGPNGDLAVAGPSGVTVLDPSGASRAQVAPAGSGLVAALSWSPTGGRLAYSVDNYLWMLDPNTLSLLAGPVTTPTFVIPNGLAFSPEGRRVAVAIDDGSVFLVDATTLTSVGALARELEEPASAVVFSPDGSRLAVAGVDGAVHYIDTATMRDIGPALVTSSSPITAIAFADGGSSIVTSAQGASDIITRSVDRTKWSQAACAAAGRNLTADEWTRFVPDRPYEVTCPQWPAG